MNVVTVMETRRRVFNSGSSPVYRGVTEYVVLPRDNDTRIANIVRRRIKTWRRKRALAERSGARP